MPLGAVPTGRQSTSDESGGQVRLLLISLASLSFSDAFAAQQPNGFQPPNHRAHSNLKNHDRSENHGVDPNENHHCQSKGLPRRKCHLLCLYTRRAFRAFGICKYRRRLSAAQARRRTLLKLLTRRAAIWKSRTALPHVRIRFPQPKGFASANTSAQTLAVTAQAHRVVLGKSRDLCFAPFTIRILAG